MKMNIAKEYVNSLEEIQYLSTRADILSNESISDIVSKISKYFANSFNGIINSFITSNNKLNSVSKRDLSVQAKDILDLTNDIKYIVKNVKMKDVASKEIGAILGLNMNLYDLSNELKIRSTNINSKLLVALDELDTIVSKLLVDNDYRIQRKPINVSVDIVTDHNYNDELIAKAINPSSVDDLIRVDKLLPNISSLPIIQDNLIKSNNEFTYKFIKNISSIISTLVKKMNMLYDRMDSEDIVVSKTMLKTLAYTVDDTAKYVTSSTHIFYLLQQTNTTLLNTVRGIK